MSAPQAAPNVRLRSTNTREVSGSPTYQPARSLATKSLQADHLFGVSGRDWPPALPPKPCTEPFTETKDTRLVTPYPPKTCTWSIYFRYADDQNLVTGPDKNLLLGTSLRGPEDPSQCTSNPGTWCLKLQFPDANWLDMVTALDDRFVAIRNAGISTCTRMITISAGHHMGLCNVAITGQGLAKPNGSVSSAGVPVHSPIFPLVLQPQSLFTSPHSLVYILRLTSWLYSAIQSLFYSCPVLLRRGYNTSRLIIPTDSPIVTTRTAR